MFLDFWTNFSPKVDTFQKGILAKQNTNVKGHTKNVIRISSWPSTSGLNVAGSLTKSPKKLKDSGKVNEVIIPIKLNPKTKQEARMKKLSADFTKVGDAKKVSRSADSITQIKPTTTTTQTIKPVWQLENLGATFRRR